MIGRNPMERMEGDVNRSEARDRWQQEQLDEAALNLLREDERHFFHQSLSTPCLNALSSCEGSYIVDTQGRRYLDFHGNSVHQVGYGHPTVVQAVKEQLDAMSFCPRRYTNIPAVELAKKLTALAPGELNKVLFAPGGTAAIGMALKLARLATGRFKTISWWDAFHGASLDAISVGGEGLFRAGMGPLLPGSIHVPPPAGYRGAVTSEGPSAMESADYVEYIMEREGDIAAFVAEPMRCTSLIIPPKEYWERIRALCDKHGALLIFDEIPICLGRTGRMFACEHFGVVPDLLCIGKGLGGGIMPMAAMIGRGDLDIAGDRALGHYTHEKSPVGCAAALATLEVIDREGLVQRAGEMGAWAISRLRGLMEKHALIGDVRGMGLALAVELVRDRQSKELAASEAEAMLYASLRRGLSFKVSSGNILTLMPPLTISEEEFGQAIAILDDSLAEISATS